MDKREEDELNNYELRKIKRESIETLEIHRDTVIDFIAVWGPLCAPLVPAGLTAAAIVVSFPDLLHITVWGAWLIAIITVIALEVLGIVSVETWLDMRRYNAENKAAEELAPEGQALTVVVIYAVVVLSLVFVLKIWNSAALYSLVPLTMLGLITSWTIVLRKQHNQRKWDADQSGMEMDEIDKLKKALEEERESWADKLSRRESELNQEMKSRIASIKDELGKQSEIANASLEEGQKRYDEFQTKYRDFQTKYERLSAEYESLSEELRLSNEKYEDVLSRYTEAKKQFELDSVLSEMTDKQRENLMEIIDLVGKNRVTGPSDLIDISSMSKGTIYNVWQVALASRAIYKNGDGAYHVKA